jgi:hypothetical protein
MVHSKRSSGKLLHRLLAAVFALAMLLTMTACGEEETTGETKGSAGETVSQTEATTEVAIETQPPTVLSVKGTTAKSGDKAVTVTVELSGNPGILGMDFDVYYDDAVMTLVDAKSTIEDPGCVFTPPAYYRNPTAFLWDFQDAGWAADGTILTLTFDISETAPAGEYEVKLMYSYGNIFDTDANPIDVKVTSTTITVEES